MKKYIILHLDSLEVLDDLTKEQAGELFLAIKSYHLGEELKLSPIVKIAFCAFKNQFKRDNDKYENICERNTINGKKGGRPRKTQDNPENPDGSLGNPDKPRKPIKNRNNKNNNNNKNNIEVKEEKTPTPLSVANNFFKPNSQLKVKVIDYLVQSRSVPILIATKEVDKFIDYWTEPTKNGKRAKWELQQTFDVKRRLLNWLRNIDKFSNKNDEKEDLYKNVKF